MARSERFELPTLGIERRVSKRNFALSPLTLAALVDSVWDFFWDLLRGEPDAAIEFLARHMRLSPLDL